MKKIILIPAYNEEKNIVDVIDGITLTQPDYDYVVINDGSTDATEELLQKHQINHISLPLNLGFSGAIQTGYRYAYENGYDVAVQLDGDGQHLPEYIPTLVGAIEDGADLAIGSRYIDKKKPWTMRMFGSRLIGFCIWLVTGRRLTDPTSGMRAVGRQVMEVFSWNLDFIAEPDTNVYLIKNHYKVKEVSVSMEERKGGKSHFSNPLNALRYMSQIIVSILFVQSMRGNDK